MMIVFFLAEDPKTGLIIDDAFLPGGEEAPHVFRSKEENKWRSERRARILCEGWKVDLLDCDGPFPQSLYRLGCESTRNRDPPSIRP